MKMDTQKLHGANPVLWNMWVQWTFPHDDTLCCNLILLIINGSKSKFNKRDTNISNQINLL